MITTATTRVAANTIKQRSLPTSTSQIQHDGGILRSSFVPVSKFSRSCCGMTNAFVRSVCVTPANFGSICSSSTHKGYERNRLFNSKLLQRQYWWGNVNCTTNKFEILKPSSSKHRNHPIVFATISPVVGRGAHKYFCSSTTTIDSSTTTSISDTSSRERLLHYKWIYPNNVTGTSDDNIRRKNTIHTIRSTISNKEIVVFVFLHGLFGQGKNLNTMAQHMINTYQQQRQSNIITMGILIDLYGHGQSETNTSGSPSTTSGIQDIMSDSLYTTLRFCFGKLQSESKEPIKMILVGHSLGGRVALYYTVQQLLKKNIINTEHFNDASDHPDVQQHQNDDFALVPHDIWLLDTVPNKPDGTVIQVLDAIVSTIPIYHRTVEQIVPGNGADNNRAGFRTRQDIRLMIQNYKRPIRSSDGSTSVNKIPDSIADWIASQWLLKEQRIQFDVPTVQLIVNDLLNSSDNSNDDDDAIDAVDSPSVEVTTTNMKDDPNDRRQTKSLSFWNQVMIIIQHSQPGQQSITADQSLHHSHDPRQIYIVQASKNTMGWNDPTTKSTLQSLLKEYPNSIHHYILPNSGHWVHVDNLPGLIEYFRQVYIK